MPGRGEHKVGYCAECGVALADGAKFCHVCGHHVVEAAPTEAAPTMPQKTATPAAPPRPTTPPAPPGMTPADVHRGDRESSPGTAKQKRKRWPWAVAAALLLLIIIGAAAGGSNKGSSGSNQASVTVPTPPEEPTVSLHLNAGNYTTTSSHATLSGTVTPGAQVIVNRQPAQLHGGFWVASFGLQHGENTVSVVATMAGHHSAESSINITREESQAEKAAEAAAKAAEVAAEENSYKSKAAEIPYPELNKNPEAFDGKYVTYTGQIFQIQEETGGGGWMLLSVTDEDEFWSNHIYVSFTGHVNGAEKSIVTIWGKVTGTKSYKTQIGGETYVPEVEAKYVSG